MKSYQYDFEPVGGLNVWTKSNKLKVVELIVRNQQGIPKPKRVREEGELEPKSQGPRKLTFQLCSHCKQPVYNKRKCTLQVSFPLINSTFLVEHSLFDLPFFYMTRLVPPLVVHNLNLHNLQYMS